MILTLTSWGTAVWGKLSEQSIQIPATHAGLNQSGGAAACLLMSRLGQLYRLGVKQSCREGTSAMKILPHYSPLTAHSVMGTAAEVGPYPACVRTHICAFFYVCIRTLMRVRTGTDVCFHMCTHRNTQGIFFPPSHALSSPILIIRVVPS